MTGFSSNIAPAVAEALHDAVNRSDVGYASVASGLGGAFAGFAGRRWGWDVDAASVTAVTDVGTGVVQLLRVLTSPGDAVVINTSGCGTTVKDYGFMFRTEPEPIRAKAERISGLAVDITEFLTRIGYAPMRPNPGLTVAYHSACSLQHGQGITSQLLHRVGIVRTGGLPDPSLVEHQDLKRFGKPGEQRGGLSQGR